MRSHGAHAIHAAEQTLEDSLGDRRDGTVMAPSGGLNPAAARSAGQGGGAVEPRKRRWTD